VLLNAISALRALRSHGGNASPQPDNLGLQCVGGGEGSSYLSGAIVSTGRIAIGRNGYRLDLVA
jgi:hypothetical protein